MTQHSITPVILCGGSGTRLWPLSRKGYPKQFARIIGEQSLLQSCARRLHGKDGSIEFQAPVVVTNSEFRFMVTEQMLEVGVEPGAVLIEPEARNTAPAVLAAALHVAMKDANGLMLVAPSDHVIPEQELFREAVARGAVAALDGRIVTFGVKPTHPETGYGYLELGEVPDEKTHSVPLERFVEKPDLDAAQAMLLDGKYLWNAGIFLFRACDILEAFSLYADTIIEAVQTSYKRARVDLGFLRLDAEAWVSVKSISIDYAVMEHAKNLCVVPYNHGWSDLGSWAAVKTEMSSDSSGVSSSGSVTAVDCQSSLLRSEADGVELVGLGLSQTIVIATSDAVLVADMSRAQEVGEVVKILRERNIRQADNFARDHRPWGYFETLALSDRFQVKRIVVKPGGALSLQSHVHRAEHWIVVAGTAKVTIDGTVQLVSENESIYVPLGAVHRMENPGRVPMTLIEVQTGVYLGEDDIVRYEDVYARESAN